MAGHAEHAPAAAAAGASGAVAHATSSYRLYWGAWAVLLVLTVLMVTIHNKTLLLCGIGMKSLIIGAWFMHLKFESKLLAWSVLVGFGFALFLFFLIQFDVKMVVTPP